MAVTLILSGLDVWRIKTGLRNVIGSMHLGDEDSGEVAGFEATLARLDEALPPRQPRPVTIGGGEPPPPPAPRERFMPRAQEATVTLVARGMSNTQIAAELHVDISTVKKNLQNAAKRLGARNRAHAVAVALTRGWIEFEETDD